MDNKIIILRQNKAPIKYGKKFSVYENQHRDIHEENQECPFLGCEVIGIRVHEKFDYISGLRKYCYNCAHRDSGDLCSVNVPCYKRSEWRMK